MPLWPQPGPLRGHDAAVVQAHGRLASKGRPLRSQDSDPALAGMSRAGDSHAGSLLQWLCAAILIFGAGNLPQAANYCGLCDPRRALRSQPAVARSALPALLLHQRRSGAAPWPAFSTASLRSRCGNCGSWLGLLGDGEGALQGAEGAHRLCHCGHLLPATEHRR